MFPTAGTRIPASAAPGRWKRWRLPQFLGVCATLVWAFAVGAGIERVWRYESTPGATAAGPQTWPGSTLVKPRPGDPTLVMFVHPRCPCSRASLAELREIMAQAQGHLHASLLFLRPQGTADVWERTPTWNAAQSIPGVAVSVDRDGVEAARFGASTSGHTVLYSPKGQLLFAGGITAARGHVGDNSGRRSVLALLKNKSADPAHPVFGCRLRDRAPRDGGV
jgi:hypothetical protein